MYSTRSADIKKTLFRGSCNLSKKKKRSKWNKAFGFCFGTAIVFFSGSLENRCSLKNRIFTLRFFGFTSLRFLLYLGPFDFFIPSVFRGFVLGIRFMGSSEVRKNKPPKTEPLIDSQHPFLVDRNSLQNVLTEKRMRKQHYQFWAFTNIVYQYL